MLLLTKNLYYKIDGDVHRLLRTLSEIQRILYLGDDFRTPKEILRLRNVCFEHFILLKKLIRIEKLSAKMTRDKLYGMYLNTIYWFTHLCIPTHEILCGKEDEIVQYISTSFLMDKIFSDTPSSLTVPSSLSTVVENEKEELLEDDISDFQLVESDTLVITNLEATENMEIENK